MCVSVQFLYFCTVWTRPTWNEWHTHSAANTTLRNNCKHKVSKEPVHRKHAAQYHTHRLCAYNRKQRAPLRREDTARLNGLLWWRQRHHQQSEQYMQAGTEHHVLTLLSERHSRNHVSILLFSFSEPVWILALSWQERRPVQSSAAGPLQNLMHPSFVRSYCWQSGYSPLTVGITDKAFSPRWIFSLFRPFSINLHGNKPTNTGHSELLKCQQISTMSA